MYQYMLRVHLMRGTLTVTSVMKGTGMLAEGGVELGKPLKWNSRLPLLAVETSLKARHAGLWKLILEGAYGLCGEEVGRTMMRLWGAVVTVIVIANEHGRASVFNAPLKFGDALTVGHQGTSRSALVLV
jgi:hypothetical protein